MSFDDVGRLRALADYRVLDTPAEESFDNITKLAAKIFGTPISLVSLVDEHRQWFKSRHGIDASETSRDVSFCDHAVRSDQTLIVPDTHLDPRFAKNALVLGAPHIRFYCGVPLRTPEGHSLGSLCVIDRQPRSLDAGQIALLESLGRQVELELEIRRRLELLEEKLGKALSRAKSQELLASMIVHDMRGPLTAIIMLTSSINPGDKDSKLSLEGLVSEADRLRRMLLDILDVCLNEVGGLRLRRRVFSLTAAATEVVLRVSQSVAARGSCIQLEAADVPLLVDADPELIQRLLENLVSNAVQHAPERAEVSLSFRQLSPERVQGEVTDRGSVIPEAERRSIFEPLTRGNGSAHRGHGLGLAFCRLAVEAHGGKLGVRPNANGVGNTFYFELPAS
ncbi:MAG: hypothetical protein RL685_5410 [Pseudomonadota bacterium]|jgi:signal transduction histidine kinase